MSMTKIQQVTVGAGGAANIEFTGIPAIYTDLKLVFSIREATTDNVAANVLINGALASLSERFLFGTGSSTGSSSTSQFNTYINYNTSTANTFGNGEVYIPNYASTTAPKSLSTDAVSENNASTAFTRIGAGLFNSNTAISSVGIQAVGGNVAAGSSATLYGINRTQAIGKPKAIGGNITFANGHWVHTFTGSGTFSAQEDLTVEALVVAGGGGGAGERVSGGQTTAGGGGGAGGYRLFNQILAAESSHPIVVGAGGSGGIGDLIPSTSGSFSMFGNVISTGGGASNFRAVGSAGGSGGGGSFESAGGAGTAGQGFAGGLALWSSNNYANAGGGGGASGAGVNATTTVAGNGGPGVLSGITGATIARAGGGGGASGRHTRGLGQAGGGDGASGDADGFSATVNTGSGGGGSSSNGNGVGRVGGNGGSGIVIIRYPAE